MFFDTKKTNSAFSESSIYAFDPPGRPRHSLKFVSERMDCPDLDIFEGYQHSFFHNRDHNLYAKFHFCRLTRVTLVDRAL